MKPLDALLRSAFPARPAAQIVLARDGRVSAAIVMAERASAAQSEAVRDSADYGCLPPEDLKQ